MATILDKYPNVAIIKGLLPVAATGSSVTKLETGLTSQQKIAWEVESVEVHLPAGDWTAAFAGAGDHINFQLTQDPSTVLNPTLLYPGMNPAVLDFFDFGIWGVRDDYHQRHDFKSPRLFIPQNVYFSIYQDISALVLGYATMRLWYRAIEISSQDWYDLLQIRMPLTN